MLLRSHNTFFLKRFVSCCRSMSTVRTPPVTPVLIGTPISKEEFGNFMAVFPDIVKDLTDNGVKLDVPDVTKWFENVCVTMILFFSYILYIIIYTYILRYITLYRCCNTTYPVVKIIED